MKVLNLQNDSNSVELLNDAWSEKETFVIVSRKRLWSQSSIDAIKRSLPSTLSREHFILFSSGSTGVPKAVLGKKDRCEALSEVIHSYQQNSDVETTIAILPISYSFALINQWLWSRCFNKTIVVLPGLSDPASFQKLLIEHRDIMLCMVSSQVQYVKSLFPGGTFPNVIRLNFAGSLFPQHELGDLYRLFPNAVILNNYGCVEAMPRLSYRYAESASDSYNVGHPLPGIQMKIGVDDLISFSSPYAAIGYIEGEILNLYNPTDWIPTGDFGKMTPDGSFEILGRSTDQLNRYGEKVPVFEIINRVKKFISSPVTWYPDIDSRGERGFVLVVEHLTDISGVIPNLLEFFRDCMPRSHWPLRLEVISDIPLSANGKIDKSALVTSPKKVLWKQRI